MSLRRLFPEGGHVGYTARGPELMYKENMYHSSENISASLVQWYKAPITGGDLYHTSYDMSKAAIPAPWRSLQKRRPKTKKAAKRYLNSKPGEVPSLSLAH